MASFLLRDVRIFDGEQTIEKGSVLVEHGTISQVSSSTIDHQGTIYSKPGHTVLPGLIDVHVHCDGANDVALPQSLRFGVTTVCDMHNEWDNIQTLRKQREGGDCADLKTTSFAATIDNGWPMPIVLAHSSDEKVPMKSRLSPLDLTDDRRFRYWLSLRRGRSWSRRRMAESTSKTGSEKALITSSSCTSLVS